jgi:hypothetical protein
VNGGQSIRVERVKSKSKALKVMEFLLLWSLPVVAEDWKPHEVRQINGSAGDMQLPAQFQIVTETWNRVVAVPYLAYLPEKDRLLMLVNCDYPHHAEVLFSDDRGATWSSPKPAAGLAKDLPQRLQKPRSILVILENLLKPIPAIQHTINRAGIFHS